jgi:hypothetical protein
MLGWSFSTPSRNTTEINVSRKVRDLLEELSKYDPESVIRWNLYWDVDYQRMLDDPDMEIWPDPAFEPEILDKLEVYLFYDEPEGD